MVSGVNTRIGRAIARGGKGGCRRKTAAEREKRYREPGSRYRSERRTPIAQLDLCRI